MMVTYREEKDSIGTRMVPKEAYYGVQSMRASENFRITGRKVHPELIKAALEIKLAAAESNLSAGVMEKSVAEAIIKASRELIKDNNFEDFIVDAVQGGAGTSLNMNVNEVVANHAIELLGGEKGDYTMVHPNDHVNCGQSTNDVFPSAGKIAAIRLLKKAVQELELLKQSFVEKSEEYRGVIKMGRTEMQDAVPISFGQVFGSYASAISRDIIRFDLAVSELSELNMGATAIGTGINADSLYSCSIVPNLSRITGLELTKAENLVDATQNLDSFVHVSGIVKSCAATISKISNDLRLMSSGPRTGFGEINLPPRQNGSSIMPGKINPVIPEVVNQISFNIIGNDTTITMAAEAGQLELNAFEPIIFYCLFESLETLANGVHVLSEDCIKGITINTSRCREELEESLGLVTAICPHIGYTEAARLAKKALKENKTIRCVLTEEKVIEEDKLDIILNPSAMV